MENGQSIVLNLADRYARAFGIVAISEAMHQVVVTKEENKYKVAFFSSKDSNFQQVVLEYESVRLEFNSMIGGKNSSVLAPSPIFTFSREKNLVETQINGSDNVVVERWGTKQWEIKIDGILIDMEAHRYPNKEIEEVVRLFEYNGIIKVVGEQFYDKGIDSIYISSIEFRSVQGYSDTIQYSISAKSIKEVGFSLLENE